MREPRQQAQSWSKWLCENRPPTGPTAAGSLHLEGRLTHQQILESTRLNLNRSQRSDCSTRHDTPARTQVVYK